MGQPSRQMLTDVGVQTMLLCGVGLVLTARNTNDSRNYSATLWCQRIKSRKCSTFDHLEINYPIWVTCSDVATYNFVIMMGLFKIITTLSCVFGKSVMEVLLRYSGSQRLPFCHLSCIVSWFKPEMRIYSPVSNYCYTERKKAIVWHWYMSWTPFGRYQDKEEIILQVLRKRDLPRHFSEES
jgi:hypothetical protein